MMNPMLEYIQNVFMMALCLWREARGEPREGKIAVAYTIMNRVERPSWWGDTVMSVLTKKWQYSSLTDPNDKQLTMYPTEGDPRWEECLEIAQKVYTGDLANPAPHADSYFADTIKPPKWADPGKFVVKIGHHSFYNLDADYERT